MFARTHSTPSVLQRRLCASSTYHISGTVKVSARAWASLADPASSSRPTPSSAAPAPKPFDAIPSVPRVPLLGSAIEFGRLEPKDTGKKFHLVVKKLAAKYGPIVRLRMPGYDRDAVLVTDPDMVADVHRNEGPFPKRPGVLTWLHMREKRQVPLGVVFENGPEWKKLRLAVQAPISQPKNVNAHCPAIDRATVQAMANLFQELHEAGPQTLAGKDPFVMEDLVMRWTIEAVSEVILGQRLGALDADPNPLARDMVRTVNAMGETTGPVVMLPTLVWRNQLTRTAREHFAAMEEMMDVTRTLMDTTLTECARDPAKVQGTFLGHVLQRDASITRADLLSTTVDLLIAGIDTTSRTLLNAMNLLGRYPSVQEKLRDEIARVVGVDPNMAVDATHLAQFKYLRNVIMETTRVCAVFPINMRFLAQDAVIGEYAVPQDTEMMLGMEAIAHNGRYFTDPDKFDPDRWDRGGIHPSAHLPFGFGPRMCVGRRIAETEMAMFLANLLRRFEIMPSPAPNDVVFNIVLATATPMPLRFRPLNGTTAVA
ncbi:hypothetical protein GGF31_000700 [Allomyces arbusculus]|nr:hypothetical protein GGF31_000700 [Allomyces arbusculus]